VTRLLKETANVNIRNKAGRTPFTLAVMSWWMTWLKRSSSQVKLSTLLLLTTGVRVPCTTSSTGTTKVLQETFADLLLSKGAPMNLGPKALTFTPLELAVLCRKTNLVKCFLDSGKCNADSCSLKAENRLDDRQQKTADFIDDTLRGMGENSE
jgi:hypothetical protein